MKMVGCLNPPFPGYFGGPALKWALARSGVLGGRKIFSLPPCYKDDKVFGRYGSGWIGAGGCRFLNGLGMCEGAFSNGV